MASAAVSRAVPTLTLDAAVAALDTAVPGSPSNRTRALAEIADHLVACSDALVSGDSRCPLVLIRLAHVLHERGHAVVVPACARCGATTPKLMHVLPEGRICSTCNNRSRLTTCIRCGRDVRITVRGADGLVCRSCHDNDPETFEQCAGCGRMKTPYQRLRDGRPLCRGCRPRPTHRCRWCGETRPAAVLDEAGACCYRCYRRRARPNRLCGRCGRIRPIVHAATDIHPDLCDSCYRGPEAQCSRCGRVQPCIRTTSSAPICRSCYHRHERPDVICRLCGKTAPAHANWPLGPVCHACYLTILRKPGECGTCGTVAPLIGCNSDGTRICGPCSRYHTDYTCGVCGRSGYLYGRTGCAYCVLATRARTLLTGPHSNVPSDLEPLLDSLVNVTNPFQQINWLTRSPTTALLTQVAAVNEPITHDLLDGFPLNSSLHYLRQLLVHTGVLPQRNEDLERLPAWLDHHLTDRPIAHQALVRPFLHWHLLRRARRRAAARRHPATSSSEIRYRVLVTLELLEWIDNQGLSLQSLRQDDLDRWLDESTGRRNYAARPFLRWAHQRGLTNAIAIPPTRSQRHAELPDQDQRRQLLRRCLTDAAMPVDVRAVGALSLLFGLSGERIRHLTADQLLDQPPDTYLAMGEHPLLLPPRLASLLRELADRPPQLPTPPGITRARWLFPGLVPGQPIRNCNLSTRLNRYGIALRTARNGALVDLATDLPAPILADLLGIHITTAIHWGKYTRRDWTYYLSAREAERSGDTDHH